jgi:hypothetical protein
MASFDPLHPLRRRAFQHALEDGAVDIVVGFYTLMVAVATQKRVFLALSIVYLAGMHLAWKHLHDSIASRRTGYAELPQDPPSILLPVILLAGVLTISVVAGVTLFGGRLWSLDHWPTWTPVLSGTILAGGFLHTAVRSGLPRYHAFAMLSVGLSVFFWLFPFGPRINPSDRLTLSLFATAALLIVAGTVTMVRFVRLRPVVSSEDGHGR